MTQKAVKLWQKMSFWTKIKAILVACGAGGEITVLATESLPYWHLIVVGCTIASVVITNFCKDLNNNDVVDIFEKKETKKPDDESGS